MSALSAAAVVVGAGCGESANLAGPAADGTYRVSVEQLTFPKGQKLAVPAEMRMTVRNVGREAIPNLAITMDGFTTRSTQRGMADPRIPTWVVTNPPLTGTTAYTNTWAFGELKAGRAREIIWSVVPVRSGAQTLRYQINGGLGGDSTDTPVDTGTVAVDISPAPDQATVDPGSGDVQIDGGGTETPTEPPAQDLPQPVLPPQSGSDGR